MATGTSAGFFGAKKPPAVLKHKLLEYYVAPYVGMVGSTNKAGRVVFVDGYAGVGRYDDGSPGSPALAMEVALGMKPKGRTLDCVFVEKDAKSFASLDLVVAEYQTLGVTCRAIHDPVEKHLNELITGAAGVPLFMFLDPCGVGVPFDRLTTMLNGPRSVAYPSTEMLLNFSDKAVRHIGGQLAPDVTVRSGLSRLDAACGMWWRQTYLDAATGGNGEAGVQAVVSEYAERLRKTTGALVKIAAVRTKPEHVPLYHLVFVTRSNYGLWVFADALARAEMAWRAAQWEEEPDDPHEMGMLFGNESMLAAAETELQRRATEGLVDNLRGLISEHPSFRLVDQVEDVFGDWYGIARETWVRDAIKHLHTRGETPSTGVGKRVRELVVERPSRAAG